MIYTLTLNPAVDRELTVPAIEYDTVLRAAHSQVDFGGKGFNVSRLLQRRGAHTLLDTNGEPLRLGCQAGPFLVKPNLEEARSLTGMALGSPAEIARAAVAIHQTGVENVVISMGKDGALLLAQEAAWRVCSPPIVERNPIGAGDSMVGGLVYGLTQELSLREALGWGVASGAATASLSGTQVGSRPQIEALVAQIRYEMVRFV